MIIFQNIENIKIDQKSTTVVVENFEGFLLQYF